MKILQVVPYFSWSYGGPVKSVYELSKSLSEMGHDVTIFTTDVCRDHRLPDNDKIKLGGVNVRYFKCFSNWAASNMKLHLSPAMRLAIKNELKNFDLVHLHDYRSVTHFYIQHYAIKYGVPYILQAHGAAPKIYGNQSFKFTFSKIFFDFFFGQKILMNSSKLIALTKTEASQYLELGANPSKIEIVPNGIRLSEYQKLPEVGAFRRKYCIGSNEKIILYLGRIHKIKGIDLLLRSFSDMAFNSDSTKLVIVGPDDGYLSELKQQIKDLNLGDKILYIGPLYGHDKLSAYVDANVYVLPSVYETFPMTVLEAFACGKPVIVTDKCGISDFVKKVGYVIKYDETELKTSLLTILSDEELTRKFGEESKKMVERRFNLDLVIKNIISVYDSVLTGRSDV